MDDVTNVTDDPSEERRKSKQSKAEKDKAAQIECDKAKAKADAKAKANADAKAKKKQGPTQRPSSRLRPKIPTRDQRSYYVRRKYWRVSAFA